MSWFLLFVVSVHCLISSCTWLLLCFGHCVWNFALEVTLYLGDFLFQQLLLYWCLKELAVWDYINLPSGFDIWNRVWVSLRISMLLIHVIFRVLFFRVSTKSAWVFPSTLSFFLPDLSGPWTIKFYLLGPARLSKASFSFFVELNITLWLALNPEWTC